jgi:predicted Zn-dependent protease
MVLKPEDISLCFEGSLAFASCTNQSVLYVDSFAIKSIDMEVIQYGLMHALGHLLGLAHDDITDNFMYPKFHAKEPTVSERDVEFLKLVYGLKAEGNTRA